MSFESKEVLEKYRRRRKISLIVGIVLIFLVVAVIIGLFFVLPLYLLPLI
jgi:predicted nucleic acid-binding Zn ribbon protein